MDENRGINVAAAIDIGAAIGLVLGIVVGFATDLPLPPEAGLVAGGMIAWAWRRARA